MMLRAVLIFTLIRTMLPTQIGDDHTFAATAQDEQRCLS